MMKLSPASDVILLGGTDKTSAYVLADLLGTITYEITCMNREPGSGASIPEPCLYLLDYSCR